MEELSALHCIRRREVVLRLCRELKANEVKRLQEFVEGLIQATYATVPGIPTKSFIGAANASDGVHQPIEGCFEGLEVQRSVIHQDE